MLQTHTTAPNLPVDHRLPPPVVPRPMVLLLAILGVVGLFGAIQAISALSARGPHPAVVAPLDIYLSGTVGGLVVVDDPAAIELTLDGGVFAVEALDAAAPLRIDFAPGVPIVPGVLFDLGTFPLRLQLFLDGSGTGRTFTTRAGELTVADGAVQISAQLSDEFGASQYLGASIALPTP